MDCVNHPGIQADSYCQRCGKALCLLCISRNQGIVLCSSCLEKTSTEARGGWTVDTRYSQQTRRPLSPFLTCGYVGALASLAVLLVVFAFYEFFVPYLGWTAQFYLLFYEILSWGVYFPVSVLVALGYWGLRVKYDEPFLAASAAATAGYQPASLLISFVLSFVPMWYSAQLYFIEYIGLATATAFLVILGLLRIRHKCVRPVLLNAVLAFKGTGLVLTLAYNLIIYLSLYTVVTMVAVGLASDFVNVIGAFALVLFFGTERHAASSM